MDGEALERVFAAIDAANAEDPNLELDESGARQPKELLYGRRMSAWLDRLRPDAPAALRIAARAQHIRRWEIPRSEYPMDRKGYLVWRKRLYRFHAEAAGEILRELGHDEALIERVGFLLQKKRLTTDPDTQRLEDAACLVFLAHHFAEFAARTEREKMIDILRKTWGKMSADAHREALALELPTDARALVEAALGAAE